MEAEDEGGVNNFEHSTVIDNLSEIADDFNSKKFQYTTLLPEQVILFGWLDRRNIYILNGKQHLMIQELMILKHMLEMVLMIILIVIKKRRSH